MSLGSDRVRVTFNPSDNSDVQTIKTWAAQGIDWCATRQVNQDAEVSRLYSLAMTAIEEAAMWAVKAVTSNTSK